MTSIGNCFNLKPIIKQNCKVIIIRFVDNESSSLMQVDQESENETAEEN